MMLNKKTSIYHIYHALVYFIFDVGNPKQNIEAASDQANKQASKQATLPQSQWLIILSCWTNMSIYYLSTTRLF